MSKLEELKNNYKRNAEIKRMLDEGITLKEIADKFNVSVGLPNYLKTNFEEVQNNLKKKIEQYEAVADLYVKGYTLNQISDLIGTTKQNISRIVKLVGIKRSEGGKSKRRKELIEKIVELHGKGYTLEYIAEKLDENEMKIRQYGYKEGIELESETSKRVEGLKSKVKELRKDGLSQKEIGEELGISQAYVSNILLEINMRSKLTKEEYKKRDGEVFQDFEEGMSIKDISEKYDISELNVRRILYKFTE